MKILYILSGNISTTPRAQQSIATALKQGYSVELMMVNRSSKWKKIDINILKEWNIKYSYLSIMKNEGFLIWILSSLLHLFCIKIWSVNKENIKLTAFASSKINILYWFKLLNKKNDFDLIIGHSGMIFPAYYYSRKNDIPFGLDIEDYHPGEKIYHKDRISEEYRLKNVIKRILPYSNYFTYASPLIGEKINSLLEYKFSHNGFLINNTFPKDQFLLSECKTDKVNFIWFSQYVSYGRGLELVLPYLYKFKDRVTLTLIGNLDIDFKNQVLDKYSDILIYKDLMPQRELHLEVGKYDIGLAFELNLDINKTICLSNKIFTYMLSGVYVLATDTLAQQDLLNRFPIFGQITKIESDSLFDEVEEIIENINKIRLHKKERFIQSNSISWEYESLRLLKIWTKI